ncbi:MAG: alpha/beta fold hydrolase [Paracoccus sp. (in: a-proteobacteria)]|uniref:alpha/beta fold hydrolase n=1 Tax=Paracoccus sp. TaxID=267 RepID=UPI0026DFDB51|nr:alpha/beta fold hydrolase [Paracoccus sp. (in: a-proteobacteria)]MDO5630497.1 alpha/beta fold hydrolase [Paracoccus sp. (in: a-proteobacteria)]
MLKTYEIGDSDGKPVVMVHGLFGQARNLGALARRLAQDGRRVVSVDMRNHGDSFWSDDHTYPAMAHDLAEVVDMLGGRADLVGHSMGGKASMTLALTQPDMVRRLVVMDIAPVAYAHDQLGMIDAMEAINLTGIRLRSQADTLLAEHISDPGIRAFLLQSLNVKEDPAQWKANLRVLRARMPELVGWPAELTGTHFYNPTMLLTGDDSNYVTEEGRVAMRSHFPLGRIVRVKAAGHWLHADAPETTAGGIAAYLAGPG